MSKMKGFGGAAKYECKKTVRATCDRPGPRMSELFGLVPVLGRHQPEFNTPELEAFVSMFPEELVQDYIFLASVPSRAGVS